MKKGDSCTLFLEELQNTLPDFGTLTNTILEAYIEDERANYARTWYVFNTTLAKDYVIFLCTYLARLSGKESQQGYYETLALGSEAQESYDYFRDSCYLHEHLIRGLDAILLAYADVVEKDRVVQILVADLKKHLKLMVENLKLIQDVYSINGR